MRRRHRRSQRTTGQRARRPRHYREAGLYPLSELHCNEEAIIHEIQCDKSIRRRLFEMGVLPGTRIRVRQSAPLGDPVNYQIRGYNLSLRKHETKHIMVKPLLKKGPFPLSFLRPLEVGRIMSLEVGPQDKQSLAANGIKRGEKVSVVRRHDTLVIIQHDNRQLGLTKAVCSKIYVMTVNDSKP